MRLEPSDWEELDMALRDAYRDEDSLRRMLELKLGLSLDEISTGNFKNRVLCVVREVQKDGIVEPFLVAVRLDKPNHSPLSDIVDRLAKPLRLPFISSSKSAALRSLPVVELLADALRKCPKLCKWPKRPYASVLLRLPQDLLTQLADEANTSPPRDWCRLMIKCAAEFDGGLEYLADLVITLDDGDEARIFEEEVRKHTGGIPRKTLDEWVDLALRARVDADVMIALHTEIEPVRGFKDAQLDGMPEESQLWLILRHLGTLRPQSDGIEPIHHFLARLAEKSSDANGKGAIQQYLQARQVKSSVIPKAQSFAQESDIWSIFVFIQEKTNGTSILGYEVNIWVRTGSGEEQMVYPDEKANPNPCSRAELANMGGILSDIIKKLAGSGQVAKERIRIEFFLPDNLLGEDVASWEIKTGKTRHPLGESYSVVTRIAARLTDSELRKDWSDWIRKWQRYQEDPHLKWVASPKCTSDVKRLFRVLEERDPSRSIHGVRFEDPHCDVNEPTDSDPRCKCIDAGIPVMVWLRGDAANSTSIKEALTILFENVSADDLKDLPKWALAERRQVFDEPSAPANKLTLIWDDPARIPSGLQSQGICPDT